MKLPHIMALVLADGLSPAFARWAERQEKRILSEGIPLDLKDANYAKSIGIQQIERVRILKVNCIPLPVSEYWVSLGKRLGLPVFSPGGMALGWGIYLLPGQERSLRHELVHVAQFERLGGIRPFMHQYVSQCLTHGYADAELEREACERSIENHIRSSTSDSHPTSA